MDSTVHQRSTNNATVQHMVLSSTCTRCAAELRPPAKRNTVYLQSTKGGPWSPHCVPCAKLMVPASAAEACAPLTRSVTY